MSDFIERSNGIEPDPDGVFVFYEDYQKLQDEIELLTARVAELKATLSWVAEHAPGIEISIADRLKRLGYTEPKHSAYHDALTAQEKR